MIPSGRAHNEMLLGRRGGKHRRGHHRRRQDDGVDETDSPSEGVGIRCSMDCRLETPRQLECDDHDGRWRTSVNTNATTSHYPAAPAAQRVEAHTLCVLVDNEPGVLARVIGLFSGRGYNIDWLTVSETEHQKHLSRITIVTCGTPMVIEQIKNQLERLVPVHRVIDLTLAGAGDRARTCDGQGRGQGDRRASRPCSSRKPFARASSTRPPRASCSRSPARATRSRVHRPDDAARPGRGLPHRRRPPSPAVRKRCRAGRAFRGLRRGGT